MIKSSIARFSRGSSLSAPSGASRDRRRASAGLRNATVVAALLVSLSGTAWSADGTSVEARWQAAEDAYATQHFAVALHDFEQLAKQGNLNAAERAGQMLFFGEPLYGKAVPRDPKRASQWLTQAAKGGSEVSALLLQRIALPARAVAAEAADAPADEPYVPGPFGC